MKHKCNKSNVNYCIGTLNMQSIVCFIGCDNSWFNWIFFLLRIWWNWWLNGTSCCYFFFFIFAVIAEDRNDWRCIIFFLEYFCYHVQNAFIIAFILVAKEFIFQTNIFWLYIKFGYKIKSCFFFFIATNTESNRHFFCLFLARSSLLRTILQNILPNHPTNQ